MEAFHSYWKLHLLDSEKLPTIEDLANAQRALSNVQHEINYLESPESYYLEIFRGPVYRGGPHSLGANFVSPDENTKQRIELLKELSPDEKKKSP